MAAAAILKNPKRTPHVTLQHQVYRCRISVVGHLKERLIDEWRHFDQSNIDKAVNQWRERLRRCIREKGGHFEHQI